MRNRSISKDIVLVLFAVITAAGCSKSADPAVPSSTVPVIAAAAKAVSTIVLASSNGPEKRNRPIYEDDLYRFEYQDYGHGMVKLHDSTLVPGVFIYSQARQKWMRIERISTAGAKFGYSRSTLREIGWDFRPLAKQESVAIPLKFQPSMVDIPDSIKYIPERKAFCIGFDSQSNAADAAEIRTELFVDRRDIDTAFGR